MRPLSAVLCAAFVPAAVAASLLACGEEGVKLPANINTLKFRSITIVPSQTIADPRTGTVRALTGMHGSPVPVVLGDEDLRLAYWGHPVGSEEPDGAHVTMVRVGTDTTCGVSLESIFPDESKDSGNPASYDFDALDTHLAAVKELLTAKILWQAAFNPGRKGKCLADGEGRQRGQALSAEEEGDLWATVAVNTLRHLREGAKSPGNPTAWDEDGVKLPVDYVEYLDDPIGRGDYNLANADILFPFYQTFAHKLKLHFPDDEEKGPVVHVGGIGFTLTSGEDLDYTGESSKHPILKFVDYVSDADTKTPLDFLSFRARTLHPHQIQDIAIELRAYLDDKGLEETELICTEMSFDDDNPALLARGILDDPDLASAYLGAFQAASRIFLQDAPVDFAIAGRGPRVYSDLANHTADDPFSIEDLIVESPYFSKDGEAKPAFMSLFPFRQVTGHLRVQVSSGPDAEGMAVLASRDKNSDKKLHVIVANANVLTGDTGLNADITYQLDIQGFVPASVKTVAYKFAVLDRGSKGVSSFHFSETGVVDTLKGTGTVSFVHQMAVPSIHYLEFHKPGVN